jgi:PTS system fructose-specific IIA component
MLIPRPVVLERCSAFLPDLAAHMPTTQTTAIHQLLRPEHIRIGLEADSKPDLINRLVDLLGDHPSVDDLEAVRSATFAREAKMSTGVGKGLGLPHAKTSAATTTVAAFATTAAPVHFDAIDDEPVRMAFLLVGPQSDKSHHIKILGRISRLANRPAFRSDLLAARMPADVVDRFRDGEATLQR